MNVNLSRRRLQEIGMVALVVAGLQFVLSKWIFPLLGQSFYVIPVDFGTITSAIITFLVIFGALVAGYAVYDQRFAWKGRNIYQRLAAILLYGTLVLYAVWLLIVGTNNYLSMAIGFAIDYAIIALVISQLARKVNFLRI